MIEGTAKRCLGICPLFEAELLVELMLRNWHHPFADDQDFRSGVLESATELLLTASDSTCTEVFIEGLPSRELNFVAAVWYVEWCGTQDDCESQALRKKWLSEIRQALPVCFLSQESSEK